MVLTKEDVDKVINSIRKKGWIKGQAGDASGRACLSQHMWWELSGDVYADLYLKIDKEVHMRPINWNDLPSTTEEKVVSTLEKIKAELPA